jgi:hypothetical protein
LAASYGPARCTRLARLIRFLVRVANEKEKIMKITSLVIVLVTATALATFGQDGTLQEIKHGAKKTGKTIKNGLETVGEKTKDAAETVGEKTKETAETVGKKTKETVETVGEKTKEGANTAGRKSKRAVRKAKAEASEKRSTDQAPTTSNPNDR